MSEKLQHQSSEHYKPNHEAAEISRKNIERIKALAEQEKQPRDDLESVQAAIEREAKTSEELKPSEHEQKPRPMFQQKELKEQAFGKTMERVRSQLSPAERGFSKVVHQKTVERASNIGSKTLARPSGILGGGIAASLGSGLILYFAKHHGFTYNYSLFILLYIAGFVGGVLFELAARKLTKAK